MLISWIQYKLFERRIRHFVYDNFFVLSFGDQGLQQAFDSFLEENQNRIPTESLDRHKVSSYFAQLTDTDGENKVDLFSCFLWEYVLDNGKMPRNQKVARERMNFCLDNMCFEERNGYKVISYKLNDQYFNSHKS